MPKHVEDPKTSLVIAGNKTSIEVTSLLRELHMLRSPHSKLYSRQHAVHPFEDANRLLTICKNFDHGMFAFGSASKKRPHRLILGRTFDSHLLDMCEFKVRDYKSQHSFRAVGMKEAVAGVQPLVIFQGSSWDVCPKLKTAKSMWLDYFTPIKPNRCVLEGIGHVVVLTAPEVKQYNSGETIVEKPGEMAEAIMATEQRILFRRYLLNYQKSGSSTPRVEMTEAGPSFTMYFDRMQDADRETMKRALKVPQEVKDQDKKKK